MAKIPGRLIVDLFPDGTVRMVFLPRTGDGNASPLTAKDLDAAEVLFMTCGLTPERAAALRAEVKRNKVASVEISVEGTVAKKFRYTRPQKDTGTNHTQSSISPMSQKFVRKFPLDTLVWHGNAADSPTGVRLICLVS